MTAIDQDPQLAHTELLPPTGQQIQVGEIPLLLYSMPEDPAHPESQVNNMVGTDNPQGMERLMNGGLSALEDGEVVRFSAVSSMYDGLAPDGSDYEALDIFTVQRVGDGVAIFTTSDVSVHPRIKVDSDAQPLEITAAATQLKEIFAQGELNITGGATNIDLADKGKPLAETARTLGFDLSGRKDALVPLPDTLRANIARLQAAGLAIPNVRFFVEGHIDAPAFLQTWAEGELPASEQPGYFNHDVLQEHFRPLIVSREWGMKLPQLFAQTVIESDEMAVQEYKDQYQVNLAEPELVERTVSGEEKDNKAAMYLDQYTTELSRFLDHIDLAENDPRMPATAFSERVPHNMKYIPYMIKTVMNSPHREEFITFLDEIGSQAYNPETGTVDYETFCRELFRNAQAYWEITPGMPASPPTTLAPKGGEPQRRASPFGRASLPDEGD